MPVGATSLYFKGILCSLIFCSAVAFANPPVTLEEPTQTHPVKSKTILSRGFFVDPELREVIEHSRQCELALSMHEVAISQSNEAREAAVVNAIFHALKEEISTGRLKNITHFGAGVAILKDGKVPVGLRKNGVGDGQWGFAGGKIDPNDGSVFDGIRREVREETKLEIRNLRLLGLTMEMLFNPKTQKVEKYISFHFAADWQSGELQSPEFPDKLYKPFTWMTWEEIGQLKEPLFVTLKKLYSSGIDPTAPEYR